MKDVLNEMSLLRHTLTTIFNLLHTGSDTDLKEALFCLLDFFEVDRISLGGFQDNGRGIFMIGQAHGSQYDPVPQEALEYIPVSSLYWKMDVISGKDCIVIDDLEKYTGTHVDRVLFTRFGVQSFFAFPTIKDGQAIGYVVLETLSRKKTWTRWNVECARLFARVISSSIEKVQIRKRLPPSAHQFLNHESLFYVVFKNMAWCVEIFDEHGRMIDINQAGLTLFSTTKKDILGISIFESPNLPERAKERLLNGEIVHVDFPYDFGKVRRRGFYKSNQKGIKYIKGKCTPLRNAENQIIGYLFLAYDNTENHLNAEKLQRLYTKMKTAVDTGNSYLMELDVRRNKLNVDLNLIPDLANEAIGSFWKEMTQSYAEIRESLHPDDAHIYDHYMGQLIAGKKTHSSFVFRRIINNQTFWFRYNIRIYKRNKQNEAEVLVGYVTDISADKEKEIQLFKIREAEKLKSAFMANISHEIRTPLNAIVGFSNVLVDMNSTEETEYFRKTINRNNFLLLQLVDDILDFSRMEEDRLTFKTEEVNIKELCEETVRTYEMMLSPQVELSYHSDVPDCIIYSDRKRIRQVLSQFVGNAVKYTHKGKISIQYTILPDQTFLLKVTDTGIGISEKEIQKIFNYFYQIDHFNQGTGLGLAVAKSLIERMGGKIGVDSEEDVGSAFWFTLPLRTSAPVAGV